MRQYPKGLPSATTNEENMKELVRGGEGMGVGRIFGYLLPSPTGVFVCGCVDSYTDVIT